MRQKIRILEGPCGGLRNWRGYRVDAMRIYSEGSYMGQTPRRVAQPIESVVISW